MRATHRFNRDHLCLPGVMLIVFTASQVSAQSDGVAELVGELENAYQSAPARKAQSCNALQLRPQVPRPSGMTGRTGSAPQSAENSSHERKCILTEGSSEFDDMIDTALLIDVRAPELFNLYHINQSINLQIGLLSRKASWRDKLIVLIDDGFNDLRTLEQCGSLRSAGFRRVFMLPGGLQRWANYKALQSSTKSTSREHYSVPMDALLRTEPGRAWTIVDLSTESLGSDKDETDLSRLGRVVNAGRTTTDGKQGLAEHLPSIHRALGESSTTAIARKLIITGQNDAELERKVRELRKQHGIDAYYLAGGRDAVAEFQLKSLAMASHTPRSARLPKCGSRR